MPSTRATGHALFDLSIAGRPTQAARRLAYSTAHHSDAYARSRTISRIKLASLFMAVGDLCRAAAIGHTALDAARSLRSRRAVRELWKLAQFSGRHPKAIEAVELGERITETLGSA